MFSDSILKFNNLLLISSSTLWLVCTDNNWVSVSIFLVRLFFFKGSKINIFISIQLVCFLIKQDFAFSFFINRLFSAFKILKFQLWFSLSKYSLMSSNLFAFLNFLFTIKFINLYNTCCLFFQVHFEHCLYWNKMRQLEIQYIRIFQHQQILRFFFV